MTEASIISNISRF